MKYKFVKIPATDSDASENELNVFLAGHKILNIEKNFVQDGQSSFWAICVSYIDSKKSFGEKSAKVDYKLVLDEKDFTVFAKLRELRKELAEREGTPPYNLFTNEQLSKMVQDRVSSIEALQKISGVGSVRADKYGRQFIDTLHEEFERLEGMKKNQ